MANVIRAVLMATNSARMIVLFASVSPSSMYMAVRVGTYTHAAPIRWVSLISDPYVYIELSGIYLGVHWCGFGGEFIVRGNPDDPPLGRLGLSIMDRRV